MNFHQAELRLADLEYRFNYGQLSDEEYLRLTKQVKARDPLYWKALVGFKELWGRLRKVTCEECGGETTDPHEVNLPTANGEDYEKVAWCEKCYRGGR